jgi:hypothetical protein
MAVDMLCAIGVLVGRVRGYCVWVERVWVGESSIGRFVDAVAFDGVVNGHVFASDRGCAAFVGWWLGDL